MRKLINLVESIGVPDAKTFVTGTLIDRIIETGKFTPHGGESLYDWFEECQGWNKFPATLKDIAYDDAIRLPEFKEILYYWMKELRAPYVQADINQTKPTDFLYRAMFVSPEWITKLSTENETIPLGVYWTTGEPACHGAKETTGVEIILTTTVGEVHINWPETMESRFDFDNGDEEQEINIIKGSTIPIRHIEDATGNTIAFNASLTFVS